VEDKLSPFERARELHGQITVLLSDIDIDALPAGPRELTRRNDARARAT